MDTTMTDRINAIRTKKLELDNQQRRKMERDAEREDYLRDKIKEYAQDFNNLVTLANELQGNGFSLNDHQSYFGDTSSFCTDGIRHRVGFFVRNAFSRRKAIIGFGIENGGAFGNVDLLIDFDGNVKTRGEVSRGKLIDMEKFVEVFPDFKARFLAYVDKITK